MCVRTSISFARVASSIVVAEDFDAVFPVDPLVPVGVAAADVELPEPAISVMILSIAATSVPQFAFDELPRVCADAVLDAVVLDLPIRSSVLIWRFGSGC